MTKVYHIIASSAACGLAFAQAALAGANAYTPDPVIEDSGSDAGIILLLAVGALLVIRSLAPKPVEGAEGTSETSE